MLLSDLLERKCYVVLQSMPHGVPISSHLNAQEKGYKTQPRMIYVSVAPGPIDEDHTVGTAYC